MAAECRSASTNPIDSSAEQVAALLRRAVAGELGPRS